MPQPDASVLDYIRSHSLAVMATVRESNAPQQTLVSYFFDGADFYVTVRGFSLKAKNLTKRPETSLAIVDGRQQVVARGVARIIDDLDEVLPIMTKIREASGMPPVGSEEMRAAAQHEQRIVIVLSPVSYYPTTMPEPASASERSSRAGAS